MSNYITPEGMQRLQKKLIALSEERPKILEQVQTAREMGDLSENAEYHAAKEKQRNIDRELSNLNQKIISLKIIDPTTVPKDSIRFGAFVKLEESSSKQLFNYRLVGVDEVYDRDDDIIHVSIASPLGKAMVGKKANEEFVVKAPIGDRFFKVIEIG